MSTIRETVEKTFADRGVDVSAYSLHVDFAVEALEDREEQRDAALEAKIREVYDEPAPVGHTVEAYLVAIGLKEPEPEPGPTLSFNEDGSHSLDTEAAENLTKVVNDLRTTLDDLSEQVGNLVVFARSNGYAG